jgi:hypothetical protein
MQHFEYLQININYYPSTEEQVALPNNEEAVVWKGLQNYLKLLHTHGWIVINESKATKDQSRTYQFKRPVDGKTI